MKASMHIVHYSPDPFTGWKIPVGAYVRVGDSWEFVVAKSLPGPSCLGGHGHAANMRLYLAALENSQTPDEIGMKGGPNVFLGRESQMPMDLEDPSGWVQDHILPGKSRMTWHKNKKTSTGTRRRSSFGKTFFRNQGLEKVVQPTWEPKREGAGWLDGYDGVLSPVTHWVQGDRLLLMEPLAPLQKASLEHQAQEISNKYIAYQWAFDRAREQHLPIPDHLREPTYFGYLLQGPGTKKAKRSALKMLRQVGTAVDTADRTERDRFITEIRIQGQRASDGDGGLFED